MITRAYDNSTNEDSNNNVQIIEICPIDTESQYSDLIFYLKNGYSPLELNYKKKRSPRLKFVQHQLINDVLFRKNYDSALLRCLKKYESQKVLQELHDGPTGVQYGGDTNSYKFMHVGYYWPNLFRDTQAYVRKCKVYQTASRRQKKPALPLQLDKLPISFRLKTIIKNFIGTF